MKPEKRDADLDAAIYASWKALKMGAKPMKAFIESRDSSQLADIMDDLESLWRKAGVRNSPEGMRLVMAAAGVYYLSRLTKPKPEGYTIAVEARAERTC